MLTRHTRRYTMDNLHQNRDLRLGSIENLLRHSYQLPHFFPFRKRRAI